MKFSLPDHLTKVRKITPTNTGLIIHLIPFINQHFSDILYDMVGTDINPDLAGGKFICNKDFNKSLDIIFDLEKPQVLNIEHHLKYDSNGKKIPIQASSRSFKVNQIEDMRSYLKTLSDISKVSNHE